MKKNKGDTRTPTHKKKKEKMVNIRLKTKKMYSKKENSTHLIKAILRSHLKVLRKLYSRLWNENIRTCVRF